MLINGRPCRTEVAKVNRKEVTLDLRRSALLWHSWTAGSLYLSRVSGGPISETEARDVLSRHGPIESVWLCSQTDKEMFRLPDGIWVKFVYFQDCRDAQAVGWSRLYFGLSLTSQRSFEITQYIGSSSHPCQKKFVLVREADSIRQCLHCGERVLALCCRRRSRHLDGLTQTCAPSLWVTCQPMPRIRSFAKCSQCSVLSPMWRSSESHLCTVRLCSFPSANRSPNFR